MDENAKKLMEAFKANGIELSEENAIKIAGEAMKTPEPTKQEQNVLARMVKNTAGFVQTNANEVMHTTNTGYGEELVHTTQSDKLVELAVQYSRLLPLLKGEHPRGKFGIAADILGRAGLMKGATERTASPTSATATNKKLATGKITITQGSLALVISISRQLMNYSDVQLEQYIYNAIGESAGRTIDALILNADSTAGGTNINGNSATVGEDYFLQQPKGLRKEALAGDEGVDFVSIGTITWDDLVDMRSLMKGNVSSNLVWILEEKTYFAISKLDEYKNAAANGKTSTINGIEYESLLGSPCIVLEDFPLTHSDGKVSATGTNNVKGGIVLFDQSIVQYAFGQDLTIDSEKVLNNGVNIGASVDFGFDLANKKAGETTPRVVLGINATV